MGSYLDMEELAYSIRRKRGDRGLREAAQEIGNVSASTLSRIENGKIPDLETFLLVCDWLGVPPARFLKETSQTNEDASQDTPHAIEIQLRADRNLDTSAANALAAVVKAAYQDLVRQNSSNTEVETDK